MNQKSKFEKFKKLPTYIQEGILNSNETELKHFLDLSHKERQNLGNLPFGARKSLMNILSLKNKDIEFDDYEELLSNELQFFGHKLSHDKLKSISESANAELEALSKKKR